MHGLNFRPLEETAADLAEWLARTPDAAVAEGMTVEQETLLRQQVR